MDVEASSDWYRTIFGFEILLYKEEQGEAQVSGGLNVHAATTNGGSRA